MKEACQYLQESRRARANAHREQVIKENGKLGTIKGFTEVEHRKVLIDVRTGGKKNFSKGKKPAFNSVWRHYNIPTV